MTRLSLSQARTARAVQVVLATLTTFVALFAGPLAPMADASYYAVRLSTFDSRLLYDMNRARAAHGVAKLTLVAGPTDVWHSWACYMAAHRVLEHNPNLLSNLTHHGMTGAWTTYGENVGMAVYSGYTATQAADTLFASYKKSPEHWANILDRSYTFVGEFTKAGGGRDWNTVDFFGHGAATYNNRYGYARVTC